MTAETTLEARLERLEDCDPTLLRSGLKGLEKESLRVTPEGRISTTPHPPALGSALTHPNITTDYSEALLEFVTPPHAATEETLRFLCELQGFTYRRIQPEMLWVTSMPCAVQGDTSIPIANYGSSNVGFMKHVYRRGLDWRYGRVMQAISGIHFNFSPAEGLWDQLLIEENPDNGRRCRSAALFGLIRNFQRYGWLIPFLFGASPAICKSFMGGRKHNFEAFDEHTLYAPWATSLRMSDIGYKNKAQASLRVSTNSLAEYVASLGKAIHTPDPEYQRIGVCVDGEWRQLNANVLQIENEYYSFVRPKNIARSGEKPTHALKRAGVRYVEIRALDVNAFDPMGVSRQTLDFLEAFLLFCLLRPSAPIDAAEQARIDHNQREVAVRGRQDGLRLRAASGEVLLSDWAEAILADMEPLCRLLDRGDASRRYSHALENQLARVRDPDLTPSARVLAEMRQRRESFFEFGLRQSLEHADFFRSMPYDPGRDADLDRLARESIQHQAELEHADQAPFEEFLAEYFARD
ncbi:MAG: glutamate--cysteine ligase [Gammaproteobacteria bacterium]|jgi:glutamate--cysteine ligase